MSPKQTRKLQAECGCKSIKIHLQETPDCYNVIEQLSVYCHCSDCVGFPALCLQSAEKNNNESSSSSSPTSNTEKCIDVINHSVSATNHVFFLNGNVKIVKGQEHIQWHKLFKETTTLRFYAKCCGTPLGFRASTLNQTAIYGGLLTKQDDVDYAKKDVIYDFPAPFYAFNATSEDEKRHKGNEDIKVYGKNPPFFPVIARFLGRKIMASAKGLDDDGDFAAPKNEEDYSLGRENGCLLLKQ